MNRHQIDKGETLTELLAQTDKILSTATSKWKLIPHHVFASKPKPDGWSANECLQHLNSYGRYYLPQFEKSILPGTSNMNQFSTGWLGHYFTRLMKPQANGNIAKMNSPKNHRPTKMLDSHIVLAEFIDQQEKLLQLLHKSGNADWNTRIPISLTKMIKLKLGDVLLFYTAHQQRHCMQAEQALEVNGCG
ncbi:MAG: DinB family protein [Flammeovirgaceae bacterium]